MENRHLEGSLKAHKTKRNMLPCWWAAEEHEELELVHVGQSP